MTAHATCEDCSIIVEPVLCENHRRLKCDNCAKVSDRLLCEECAEDEFGDDGSTKEPDEEDVIELIEHMSISDEVGDLAAAIRRGDTSEAEFILDRIASRVPGWADRVSIARYSPLARAA